MRILAQRGQNVYLVELDAALGQILDLNLGKLFPPANLNELLSRGYWEHYAGDQEILPELLGKVRPVETPSFGAFLRGDQEWDLR